MYQTRLAFVDDAQAREFDLYLAEFLHMCDQDPTPPRGLLAASRHAEDGCSIRTIKSDSARMLDRFQNFLANRASPMRPAGRLFASE